MVWRLSAVAGLPAPGGVVSAGPPRSGSGGDPGHLAGGGGRGIPRHGAGRDAALGDSPLTCGAALRGTLWVSGTGLKTALRLTPPWAAVSAQYYQAVPDRCPIDRMRS